MALDTNNNSTRSDIVSPILSLFIDKLNKLNKFNKSFREQEERQGRMFSRLSRLDHSQNEVRRKC